jgi:hypothetical protein
MSAFADRSGQGGCGGVHQARARGSCRAPSLAAWRRGSDLPPIVILRGPRGLDRAGCVRPRRILPDGARGWRSGRMPAGRNPSRGRRRARERRSFGRRRRVCTGGDRAAPPSGSQRAGCGEMGRRSSPLHLPREAGEVASYRAGGGLSARGGNSATVHDPPSPLSARNERGGAGGGAGCSRRDPSIGTILAVHPKSLMPNALAAPVRPA